MFVLEFLLTGGLATRRTCPQLLQPGAQCMLGFLLIMRRLDPTGSGFFSRRGQPLEVSDCLTERASVGLSLA